MSSLCSISPRNDKYIGLHESIDSTTKTILGESHHVPTKHMILCGFGHGCTAANHALVSERIKMGGFIGLSGWLPYPRKRKSLVDMQSDIPGMRSASASPKTPTSPKSRRGSLTADSNTKLGKTDDHLPVKDLPILIGYFEKGGKAPKNLQQSLLRALEGKGAIGGDLKVYQQDEPGIKSPKVVDDIVKFMKAIFPASTQQAEEKSDDKANEKPDSKTDGQTELQNPQPYRRWCSIV